MQVELKVRNTDLADALQRYVEQRLDSAIGRFDDQVGRVVVKFSGQRGSGDRSAKSCRISAELKQSGKIAAQGTDLDLYSAIDRAAAHLGTLLIQRLEKMWGVEIWNANVLTG